MPCGYLTGYWGRSAITVAISVNCCFITVRRPSLRAMGSRICRHLRPASARWAFACVGPRISCFRSMFQARIVWGSEFALVQFNTLSCAKRYRMRPGGIEKREPDNGYVIGFATMQNGLPGRRTDDTDKRRISCMHECSPETLSKLFRVLKIPKGQSAI